MVPLVMVHLLLVSAGEVGFVWDGAQQGWIRAELLPLRMLSCLFNILRALSVRLGSSQLVFTWLNVRFSVSDVCGCQQLLVSSHLRERDKMLPSSILSGVFFSRGITNDLSRQGNATITTHT